jgi:glycosyltransferase involved in cell wall biosynthesis
MKYIVTFYCPDRHVEYDAGRTPDQKGVGGGVTARIRLAQALGRGGHQVSMICNCRRNEVDQGVHYIPLDEAREIQTDILLLSTSGGDLSLEPLLKLNVAARLKILLIYGIPKPKGMEAIGLDYYYPPSNFIRQVILNEWGGIPQEKIFVTHFGVVKQNFIPTGSATRDRFRLAYVGHPSKGRDAAIGILKLLRQRDKRFHLYIFGDERLWGEKISLRKRLSMLVPGIKNFGMINQIKLAQELLTCTYGMFLQARLEPYANTTLEALSAGVIPIASPIGGFPEQIVQGWNGFFVQGSHNDPVTWNETADLIYELSRDPERLDRLSQNARQSTYEWDIVAQSWEQHWDRVQPSNSEQGNVSTHACPNCKKQVTQSSDGYHCPHCGYFSRLTTGNHE